MSFDSLLSRDEIATIKNTPLALAIRIKIPDSSDGVYPIPENSLNHPSDEPCVSIGSFLS
jgi:hypothetical protein